LVCQLWQIRGCPAVQNLGHVFVALRTDLFLSANEFAKRMDEILGMLRACPPAPEIARVLAPGELEFRMESRNRTMGIPLAEEVVAQLVAFGTEVGVDFPPCRDDSNSQDGSL